MYEDIAQQSTQYIVNQEQIMNIPDAGLETMTDQAISNKNLTRPTKH